MGLAQLELRFVHGLDENGLPAAERALNINPGLPEAHCIKARYLEEDGQPQEAKRQIEHALELDPNSWEVNREAARILFRSGHVRESIPFFEKAASIMDTDWRNAAMLVCCYNAVGDAEKARKAAEIAVARVESVIKSDPTNCSALAMGSGSLAALGEQERARDWARRALLLDPDNLLGRYNIACALVHDLDDAEGGIEALQPYFELTSSTTEIRHAEADPDLDPIRDDPRFKQMLAAAKKRLRIQEAAE
jgi:adenylate cyclase